MSPLAQLGYDTLAAAIRRGAGPEKAWDAVAVAMTKAVRAADRAVAADRERQAMRNDIFEQEIRRQIAERQR